MNKTYKMNSNTGLKHIKNSINVDNDLVYYDILSSSPFIYKPSDFISIVRFSIDTYDSPIFIPIIDFEANDANKTIYSISVKYNSKIYSKTIMWKSQKSYISTPSKLLINSKIIIVRITTATHLTIF